MTTEQSQLTVAICCYNAAGYIDKLVAQIARLDCPVNFEILVVDNNSADNTKDIVRRRAASLSKPIRYVSEAQQGIPFARNRAIQESMQSTYLVFIDADELPHPTWLRSACSTLIEHSADCVGGKIRVDLPKRPGWMSDSLLPFLGEVDHGNTPFRIIDRSTPVWSGNVIYRTAIFSNGLRFDTRYNRKGKGVGGGEDVIMFRELLRRNYRIWYAPDMVITHLIPISKIKRSYFFKLHYSRGKKVGLYEMSAAGKTIFGAPRYMYRQAMEKTLLSLGYFFKRNPEYMREFMNVFHLLGIINGLRHQSNL